MNITQSVVSQRDRALLSGDYGAYHAQAARRIHAIRKRLGVATPRGRKFSPKGAVTAEQVAQNSEWLQLLLASSERSWASAMAMKSSQSAESTQKPMAGSTKRQIASRFRRAIQYAEQILQILRNQDVTKSTATDILEAKAYLSLLKGGLEFEKSRWESCVQNYSICRVVYATLGVKEKTDIFKDLLSSIVDPSIRYAAYQIKLPRTQSVPEIAVDKFPVSEEQLRSYVEKIDSKAFEIAPSTIETENGPKDIPKSISWRKRTVKLEDARISQALGVAKEREQALTEVFSNFKNGSVSARDLAGSYDDIINASQEAADSTKSAIDELVSEGVEPGDPRMQSLQITRTAVNYSVIEWRIGRNRMLCGADDGATFEPEKPNRTVPANKSGKKKTIKEESNGRKISRLRERVALYDSILQSCDGVKELPGVIADTEFVKELESKRTYFRALKCLAIGRSHAVGGNIPNALALYSRALDLAKSTSTKPSEVPSNNAPSKLELSSSQIESLVSNLTNLVAQYRGLAELKALTSSNSVNSQKNSTSSVQKDLPLLSQINLNQYIPPESINLHNLVNFPPKLQPVPVKPLFFDLAWNHITYPGHESSTSSILETVKAAAPQAATVTKVAEQVTGITKEELDRPATPSGETKKRGWFGFGR